jgi:hypothetical protein
VWRVPYQENAIQARSWAKQNQVQPAAGDKFKMCLVAVDVQNTFCIPGFELYVGGRSGTGAVDDNRRLCEFVYRNLGVITQICPTMDTHQAIQIFHSLYFVNDQGEHPAPYTLVSDDDVQQKRWKFNPLVAPGLGISAEYGQRHLLHYVRALKAKGKTILRFGHITECWAGLDTRLCRHSSKPSLSIASRATASLTFTSREI